MEPIDLLALSKASRGDRNAYCARTSVMPSCTRRFEITKGPSLPTICSAPSSSIPCELSRALGLDRISNNALIDRHVPLQFTLASECDQRAGYAPLYTFPVYVFVQSIDFAPDLAQAYWSIFGKDNVHFPHGSIIVRGWFRVIPHIDAHEDFSSDDFRECVIAYDPKYGKGQLGEVAAVQELPTSGVIKDLEALHQVVRSNFIGGFIESHVPDGHYIWGRIIGGFDGYVEIDAKKVDDTWRYRTPKERILLDLVGVEYTEGGRYELIGDVFLCSDGTLLHTYYFPSSSMGGIALKDSKERYYSNRLYPSGSPLIPMEVIHTFKSQMPAWFLENDEERKVK